MLYDFWQLKADQYLESIEESVIPDNYESLDYDSYSCHSSIALDKVVVARSICSSVGSAVTIYF